VFKSARIKLTAWYLVVIMTISITFSVTIYRLLINEVDRFAQAQRFRLQRQSADVPLFITLPDGTTKQLVIPEADDELVQETRQRVIYFLAMINVVILGLSGTLGYVLAGRTLAPIQKMIDEQERFISDASHELKTPLTALRSSLEVYLRDPNPSPADTREVMEGSVEEVQRLQKLTESLLTLSQSKVVAPNVKTQVSIDKCITEAIDKVRPLAKDKHIEIVYKRKMAKMDGENDRIRELFVILLDNAIKYNKENGKVIVKITKNQSQIVVKVSDTGIGIAKKDLTNIFDRFYQVSTARTKVSAGGYGLGLSIAKQIVDNNGGSIKVESKPNKGTVFQVTFRTDS
jgi:two-component system, OmpR family, sensor histidine kinase CiaH